MWRFFTEFTLSVDSSVISFLQNDINEVLRMTRRSGQDDKAEESG